MIALAVLSVMIVLVETREKELITKIAPKKLFVIIYNNLLTNIPKGGILNVSKEREVIQMTNEEKFKKGIVVYKNEENDYVCELWEASTKHPDSIFHMNHDGKYKKSGLYDDDKYEVYQWLLWIASNLTWRFHARNLAEYALREWYDVED